MRAPSRGRIALPLVFVAASTYHVLQSRGHATATVFNDELLYAKLSQAIAAGHGLSIRGEHIFFPAPLSSLVQAPAWLLGSMPNAYAAAKILNAVVMSAAVFPAYWLARQLVRPWFAILTAIAAVTTPALVYHAYLMSEALAYPVFLVTIAVLLRAVTKPSRPMAIAVPLVCLLAVATRVQFLALPLAYLAAVALCGRGDYRRHLLPVGLTAAFVALVVGVPGRARTVRRGDAPRLCPARRRALGPRRRVAPAVLGRPRDRAGRRLRTGLHADSAATQGGAAFAVLAISCTALFMGQAALIAAGEAKRPLERYLFYVTPLLFIAFFRYAERGVPRSRAYLAATCLGALALSQVSFPGLTGTGAYFFDSVSLSAFARVASRLGLPEASLLYSLAPMAIAALALAVPLRRRGAPELFALLAIAISAWMASVSTQPIGSRRPGRYGHSGHRRRTGSTVRTSAPRATSLSPTRTPSPGRTSSSGTATCAASSCSTPQPPDRFPAAVASVARDGTLQIDGKPAKAQTLVANISGLGDRARRPCRRRPRDGLVAYRIPAGAHVSWLAAGLAPDGWTGPASAIERGRPRTGPLRAEPLCPCRDAAAQDRHRQAHLRHPRRDPAANRRARPAGAPLGCSSTCRAHRSAAVSSV